MALRRFEAGRLSRLSDDSELRLRDSLAALGVVLFSRDDSGPCAGVAFADPFRRPSSEQTAKLRSQKALSARLAPPDEAISPGQCRAARGLLGWTIRNLAEASNLSTVTINNFEIGHHPLLRRSNDALRRAFAGAGVTLWHARDGSEETVRLVRASAPSEEEPERGGAT